MTKMRLSFMEKERVFDYNQIISDIDRVNICVSMDVNTGNLEIWFAKSIGSFSKITIRNLNCKITSATKNHVNQIFESAVDEYLKYMPNPKEEFYK